jgi:AcrR family transcriptional regulator
MAGTPEPHKPDGRRLPRGRHGLSRAFVVNNQRERIFASLAAVCALKGYAEVTVQDITQHAGVSRRTFYDLFADKEACFLAAYDLITDRVVGAVGRAYCVTGDSWAERISAALEALVGLFIAEPDFARLFTVEVLGAGHTALARRDAALRRFAVFFEAGLGELPGAMVDRELLVQAVIGGMYEILYTQIIEGHTERLPELLPELIYCVLVPYLGPAAALAARDAARLVVSDPGAPARPGGQAPGTPLVPPAA